MHTLTTHSHPYTHVYMCITHTIHTHMHVHTAQPHTLTPITHVCTCITHTLAHMHVHTAHIHTHHTLTPIHSCVHLHHTQAHRHLGLTLFKHPALAQNPGYKVCALDAPVPSLLSLLQEACWRQCPHLLADLASGRTLKRGPMPNSC